MALAGLMVHIHRPIRLAIRQALMGRFAALRRRANKACVRRLFPSTRPLGQLISSTELQSTNGGFPARSSDGSLLKIQTNNPKLSRRTLVFVAYSVCLVLGNLSVLRAL